MCQSFDDGRLTRTRLTYQDRIVLRTSRQDLQHAAYLVITADDRVELTLTRQVHEVLGELLQTLVVVVGTLALHLLPLAQFLDGLQHFLLCAACVLQDARCR